MNVFKRFTTLCVFQTNNQRNDSMDVDNYYYVDSFIPFTRLPFHLFFTRRAFHLSLDQCCVELALLQQFCVLSAVHDLPFAHHKDDTQR